MKSNLEFASANSLYQVSSIVLIFQADGKESEEQVVPSGSLEVLYFLGFLIVSVQLLAHCLFLNKYLQNLLI